MICPRCSYIYYGGSYSSDFGKQSNFGENSTIEMEVNMNEKTLHFFINKTQLPYVVHSITSLFLSFGISGYDTKLTVEFLSLIKLNKPSANNQNCTKFQWIMKKIVGNKVFLFLKNKLFVFKIIFIFFF
jgi:hypothetical protein